VTISPTRARGLRAAHTLRDLLARARPVELEEGLGVRRNDLLDRLARERTEAHRRAARGGRACDGDLAVRMDRLNPGRGDQHRQRHRLPHHHGRQVALIDQAGDMRREAQFPERLDIVLERQALLGPGPDRHVHRLWEPTLRASLRLGDRLEPTSGHQRPSLSRS
jgi:hypothetical protein